jgi:hypothetical protein
MKLDLKITAVDLAELQEDLEDAATDLGEEMAMSSFASEDGDMAPSPELDQAMSRMGLASEKLKRAISIFAKQKDEG